MLGPLLWNVANDVMFHLPQPRGMITVGYVDTCWSRQRGIRWKWCKIAPTPHSWWLWNKFKCSACGFNLRGIETLAKVQRRAVVTRTLPIDLLAVEHASAYDARRTMLLATMEKWARRVARADVPSGSVRVGPGCWYLVTHMLESPATWETIAQFKSTVMGAKEEAGGMGAR